MSWSVSALGKSDAVAKKLVIDFASLDNMKMDEPEQHVKNNAADSVARILAAYPKNLCVRVEASGTQYAPNGASNPERVGTHTLKIDHLGSFVE
jgi:hypothetical protein